MRKLVTITTADQAIADCGATNTANAAKCLFDEHKAEKNPHCMSYLANKGHRKLRGK